MALLSAVATGCGARRAAPEPTRPASPALFAELPADYSRCVYTEAGALGPARRALMGEESHARPLGWRAVRWAEVSQEGAFRAIGDFSEPESAFTGLSLRRLDAPWDGRCVGDCGVLRAWVVQETPLRVAFAAGPWTAGQPGPPCALEGAFEVSVVQGAQASFERRLFARRDGVEAVYELPEGTRLDALADVPMGELSVGLRGRRMVVSRFRYWDELELEEADRRLMNRARLEETRERERMPVWEVDLQSDVQLRRQLRLWTVAAGRDEAARAPLAELVGRVLRARGHEASLVATAIRDAIEAEASAAIYDAVEAHYRTVPGELTDELRTLRRALARAVDPERHAELLREEGIAANASEAQQLLLNVPATAYESAEALWRTHASMPSSRLVRVRRGARLPHASAVETLVALIDARDGAPPGIMVSAQGEGAAEARIDQLGGTAIARWSRDGGIAVAALVPPGDELRLRDLLEPFAGRVTLSVGLHDGGASIAPSLAVRAVLERDGDRWNVLRGPSGYRWEHVRRYLAEPLAAMPDRLFPAPNVVLPDEGNAIRLLERAGDDSALVCAARDGGIDCAMPPERMLARRALADLVAPLIRR